MEEEEEKEEEGEEGKVGGRRGEEEPPATESGPSWVHKENWANFFHSLF